MPQTPHSEKLYLPLIKFSEQDLFKCCGSLRWASAMAEHSFPNAKELLATASSIWWQLAPEDWAEAFRANVALADRVDLAGRTVGLAEQIRQAAARYEAQFQHPMVTLAAGKSAPQILLLLDSRAQNDGAAELRENASQQLQIMQKRLKRLLPK